MEGPIKPPREHLSERYALKPFSGTVDERMHVLFWGLANRGCHYGKESQKSLYPMLKAIYDEARAYASTQEQRDTVSVIATLAAKTALAADPTGPGIDAEVKAFKEEHLR